MKTPPLYIEPCCIQNQLPEIIRESGRFGMFYSQGDWGVPKLWNAVESLVPSQDADVITLLVLPDINLQFVRLIERELRMGWSRAFMLVTATDCTALLEANLSPEHLACVTYAPRQFAANKCNLWIRWSQRAALMVSGPLTHHDEGPKCYCQYTSHYEAPSTDELPSRLSVVPSRPLMQAFAPWRSMLRLHATLRGTSPYFASWLK